MQVGRIEYSPDYHSSKARPALDVVKGVWHLKCKCGATGISLVGPFEKCHKCGRVQGSLKLVKQ